MKKDRKKNDLEQAEEFLQRTTRKGTYELADAIFKFLNSNVHYGMLAMSILGYATFEVLYNYAKNTGRDFDFICAEYMKHLKDVKSQYDEMAAMDSVRVVNMGNGEMAN